MRGKIFTVDEANRMLPLVGRIADDIVATYAEVNQALAAYESSKARADASPAGDADLRRKDRDITWHNGQTGGFASWWGLDRVAGTGVVILSGTSASVDRPGFELLEAVTPT